MRYKNYIEILILNLSGEYVDTLTFGVNGERIDQMLDEFDFDVSAEILPSGFYYLVTGKYSDGTLIHKCQPTLLTKYI